MCQACGFYNGRMVIDMGAKAQKRSDRLQAKKDAIASQAQPDAPESTNEEVAAEAPTDALPEVAAESTEETKEEKA